MVLEPAVHVGYFSPAKLSFLASVGSEIGVILLARRFDAKLAEASKMRMAGVFSSGVAHNFNNLLQAVMGQASLIELQAGDVPGVRDSIQVIKSAASKGAGLIRQLLSFSQRETPKL